MPYSIRQRLLFALLGITILTWLLLATINYFNARSEIKELFDAHLVQSAKVLLSLVEQELKEEANKAAKEAAPNDEKSGLQNVKEHLEKHKYEKLLAFQIAVEKDNFYFTSAEAPDRLLSSGSAGFSNNYIGNINWRVYTLRDPTDTIIIRVAEPQTARSKLAHQIAFSLLLPLIIGLPVISLLIWKCVGLIFKPLDRIATDIQKRTSSQLEPVSLYAAPVEVRPLINALNRLFYRLDRTLKNERKFTADAAHELRTPLAGLKTQAQIALRTRDPVKLEHALHNVLKSVDRTTHLIEQLLLLARLEPDTRPLEFEDCNLTHLVQSVMADLSKMSLDKNITLEFNYTNSTHITANHTALTVLLRNLIDNAIRYTQVGGRVSVDLFEDPAGITIRIADNGPGIPWEERSDMFKRFYRSKHASAGGSGLGLAIVRQIAELHRAVIHLDESSSKGLQVDIYFAHMLSKQTDINHSYTPVN